MFYSVHPSDVLSKYQGESERYLKEVFRRARNQPRAIIFFDGMSPVRAAEGRVCTHTTIVPNALYFSRV